MKNSIIFLMTISLASMSIQNSMLVAMENPGVKKEVTKEIQEKWDYALSKLMGQYSYHGAIETIKRIINEGYDVNIEQAYLANFATTDEHIELAKLLIEHGAYPNPILWNGKTLLTTTEEMLEDWKKDPLIKQKKIFSLEHYLDFLEHAIKDYEIKHKK